MAVDNWMVEEVVPKFPKPDVRAIHIRLLEQVIDALKEEQVFQMGKEKEDIDRTPKWAMPTVIYAHIENETLEKNLNFRLYCFRDATEYSPDLTEGVHFDDFQNRTQIGNNSIPGKDEQPQTT